MSKDLKKPLNRQQQESEMDNSELVTGYEQDEQDDLTITQKYQFDALNNLSVWGYSLGHFYNDLCAAIWFNYLLFYIKTVRGYGAIAPWSMLGGQIFDGLATPIVGILSDKTNTSIGKRTPWYIFGTVVVTCTYLPIFIFQFLPESTPEWGKFIYMVSFPSIFNIGWASVQISNMSLVPSLTCSNTKRDILNSRRNTFTFVANLLVLTVAFIFFQVIEDGKQAFEYLAIMVVTVGMSATLFFSFTVREAKLVKRATECQKKLQRLIELDGEEEDKLPNYIKGEESSNVQIASTRSNGGNGQQVISSLKKNLSKLQANQQNNSSNRRSFGNMNLGQTLLSDENDIDFEVDQSGKLHQSIGSTKLQLKAAEMKEKGVEQGWKMWFKEGMFYICGIIYMFVRLYCNVIASMMPFYVQYVCKFGNQTEEETLQIPFQQALVPMLLYVFSSISSFFVETLFQKIGRKKTYFIGAFFAGITTVGYMFINSSNLLWMMYPVACLTGIAQALCLNTGITLISDVIGSRGSQGAFVFGVYSFLDKFCTGIVMFIVTNESIFETTVSYNRWITAIIPAVSIVVAGFCITLIKTENKEEESHSASKVNDSKFAKKRELKELAEELAS